MAHRLFSIDLMEVAGIALMAIRANKLRSVLTLLGIVIGVFSIIAVMTAVRVLQTGIESNLSQLGSHTFQIEKYPRTMGAHDHRRFRNRKDITIDQALVVAERMTLAKYVGIEAWRRGRVVKTKTIKSNPDVSVAGENLDGFATNNWNVEEGRLFSSYEYQQERNVAIIGQAVKDKLFPFGGALGSEVNADGEWYTVIGILEKKGGMLGGNQDNFIAIPLSTWLAKYGDDRSLNIMVTAASPEVFEESIDQARAILRAIRKVAPAQEDDFAFFSNDSMIEQFNDFTFYVKLGVGFISFIALVAAGVGIMNIMLVSVTERTREIGVRKAVGAQKRAILSQFLAEAVFLSQLGGVVGIALGVLGGNMMSLLTDVPPVFPVDWAAIGFIICSFIGIVFGVYPAWKAANLDPIEALRYE
jgi:putative ABC transport system permease protein